MLRAQVWATSSDGTLVRRCGLGAGSVLKQPCVLWGLGDYCVSQVSPELMGSGDR